MTKKLMIEDLARSGLIEKDIVKLKLKPLTEQQTSKLTKRKCTSYTIPYFNIQGKKTEYYRIRFLEAPKAFGSKQAKKFQRYWQESDTSPQLYFPPLINWATIAKNTERRIIITEGEKKAAKACKEGLACIGLGGVWSFKSKKLHKSLIDDFSYIEWKQREVWIVFDSDLKTNTKVLSAAYALARELTKQGAEVSVGFLPSEEEEEKVGLDDYLVDYSVQDLEEEILLDEYELSSECWKLNEELAVIKDTGSICRLSTGSLYNKESLTGVVYADKLVTLYKSNKPQEVNAVKYWLTWPLRRTYESLEYEPGKPMDLSNGNLNVWRGWGCAPKKGSIGIWNKFLNYFFNDDTEARDWFLQWLAYPLQKPGTKLFSSVLFHGTMEGTGKTFIGIIMSRIYGENFSKIKQKHLFAEHNEWAINKQFVLGEEITGSDKRHDADDLKDLITGERIFVNRKYVPQYYIRDCINYLFTSNHPDAFFLSEHDRRVMVHETPNYKWGVENYTELDAWKNGAGPAALFYHLLNEVDCSSFNPMIEAPTTAAKKRMQALSMSDVDMFVDALKESPDDILTHGGVKIDRDLFTANEIVALYDPDNAKRTANITMAKALRRAGYEQLPATKTLSGSKRLWPLRNMDKWKKAGHAERSADYDRSVIFLDKVRKAKYKEGKK